MDILGKLYSEKSEKKISVFFRLLILGFSDHTSTGVSMLTTVADISTLGSERSLKSSILSTTYLPFGLNLLGSGECCCGPVNA